MPATENPYQSPQQRPADKSPRWSFALLNITITVTLGFLVLISFLWAKFDQAQTAQQLGRRYASYDHEHHFYPMNGLIFIVLVFAVPNAILFAVRLRKRNQHR